MSESNDPTVVRTVVVGATDLVTALETSYRVANDQTVLRVTPPFSGRMRARLHVQQDLDDPAPSPVSIRPRTLVDDDCPSPPVPDEVEDALRTDPDEAYSVEYHGERYRDALDRWRRAVPNHAVDEVRLPEVNRTVTVSILGSVDDG